MEKYKNLKNKTFLDFTDDPEIIKQVLGRLSIDDILNGMTMIGRRVTFDKFATLTNNSELKIEIERQFRFVFDE